MNSEMALALCFNTLPRTVFLTHQEQTLLGRHPWPGHSQADRGQSSESTTSRWAWVRCSLSHVGPGQAALLLRGLLPASDCHAFCTLVSSVVRCTLDRQLSRQRLQMSGLQRFEHRKPGRKTRTARVFFAFFSCLPCGSGCQHLLLTQLCSG